MPTPSTTRHTTTDLEAQLEAVRAKLQAGDLTEAEAATQAVDAIKAAGAVDAFSAYHAGALAEATGVDLLSRTPARPTAYDRPGGVRVPRDALTRLVASYDALASLAETVACYCDDEDGTEAPMGGHEDRTEGHRADEDARNAVADAMAGFPAASVRLEPEEQQALQAVADRLAGDASHQAPDTGLFAWGVLAGLLTRLGVSAPTPRQDSLPESFLDFRAFIRACPAYTTAADLSEASAAQARGLVVYSELDSGRVVRGVQVADVTDRYILEA